jgi:hypothetical protein
LDLPPFDEPEYGVLRAWWVAYEDDWNVRRLILEVQTLRDAISRMSIGAEMAVSRAREGAAVPLAPSDPLFVWFRQANSHLKRSAEFIRRRATRTALVTAAA